MSDTRSAFYTVRLRDGSYLGRVGLTSPLESVPAAMAYSWPTHELAADAAAAYGHGATVEGPPVVVTDAQRATIDAQVARYFHDDTPCLGLHHYTIRNAAEAWWEFFGEDEPKNEPCPYPEGSVTVAFHYRHEDDERIGLEETVFAPDGTVVTSQDLG